MLRTGENRGREKSVTVSLYPPKIPNGLVWNRTRTLDATVGRQITSVKYGVVYIK